MVSIIKWYFVRDFLGIKYSKRSWHVVLKFLPQRYCAIRLEILVSAPNLHLCMLPPLHLMQRAESNAFLVSFKSSES